MSAPHKRQLSLRYRRLRIASRRAAFALLSVFRGSAALGRLFAASSAWASVHSGQWLAKPGLSGLSSNSSEQIAQTLMGKAITLSMLIELVRMAQARSCYSTTPSSRSVSIRSISRNSGHAAK